MKKTINSKKKLDSNNNQRIISLDILRVIACFLVCYCHIVSESQYIYINSIDGNWIFVTLTFIISKIAVPIFFMISGALMLKEEQDTGKMLKKTFLRIIIPLFIFSALIYFKDNLSISVSNILEFFNQFLKGSILIPYWYLYSLIGIYIMTPFISTLVNNLDDKKYKQLIILGFVFTILLNTLKNLNIVINSGINIALTAYFYYFILGHYIFHKCKFDKKNIVVLNIISIIILIITTITIANGNIKELVNKIGDINLLIIFILSLSCFMSIKYFVEVRTLPTFVVKITEFVSPLTFGIYLIHSLFLGKLSFIFNFLIIHLNDSISVLIYSGVFFIIMCVPIYIMKKIPILKKLI